MNTIPTFMAAGDWQSKGAAGALYVVAAGTVMTIFLVVGTYFIICYPPPLPSLTHSLIHIHTYTHIQPGV